MKAQKVFENIDFKRRQDSKRAMSLGEASHPLYKYWIDAKESPNFESVTDINNDDNGDYYFEIRSKLESSNEEFHKGEKEIYTMGFDPKADEFYLIYDLNGNDWVIESLEEFQKITRSFTHVTESINFKRTGNSKKGLRVGKYRYPDWTEPEYLDRKDSEDLKQIWDHIQDGNIKLASELADKLDTIVRDELPKEIYYDILNPKILSHAAAQVLQKKLIPTNKRTYYRKP